MSEEFVPPAVDNTADLSSDKSLSDIVARRVDLDEEKKRLSAEEKDVKAQMKDLDAMLFARMREENTQSIKCHGKTVYTKNQPSITNLQGTAESAQLLIKLGMHEFLSVNTRGLCSFLREKCEENGWDIENILKALVFSSPVIQESAAGLSEDDKQTLYLGALKDVEDHLSFIILEQIGMRKS